MRKLTLFTFSLLILVVLSLSSAFALSYEITDMGVLGSDFYVINGMNSAGQVVGYGFHNGKTCALLYTPNSGLLRLGALAGDNYSTAYGINDLGQVVGASGPDVEPPEHAFLYTPGAGLSPVGDLGGSSSRAQAINNAGQIVGEATTPDEYTHAFLYTPGSGVVDLGTLGGTRSVAADISDAGHVVGFSTTSSGYRHAFTYTPQAGMSRIDTPGDYSEAYAVNNAGQVVGFYYLAGSYHGFLYSPEADIVDLGAWFIPQSVNDTGVAVGYSYEAGSLTHAFAYTADSGIIDLETLGGTQSRAYSIDDSGRITGIAYDADDNLHVVAWTPVPEPSALLALGAGIAGVVMRRRRR